MQLKVFVFVPDIVSSLKSHLKGQLDSSRRLSICSSIILSRRSYSSTKQDDASDCKDTTFILSGMLEWNSHRVETLFKDAGFFL
jgi:hypothetical protein